MILAVDDQHPGTPEDDWLAWPGFDRFPPLEVPAAQRMLVVAPHPDDEVLGAGGLVSRSAAAGTPITVLAVTDGESSHPRSASVRPADMAKWRMDESRIALFRLGCGTVQRQRLRLPDGRIAAHRQPLTDALVDALDPSTLCVAPWEADGHPDHDASGQAAIDACARTRAPLLRYLVWTWHWARPGDPRVPWSQARRLDLSSDEQARKRSASLTFVSQIEPISDQEGDEAVLPAPVLRRAWRSFEVYLR